MLEIDQVVFSVVSVELVSSKEVGLIVARCLGEEVEQITTKLMICDLRYPRSITG